MCEVSVLFDGYSYFDEAENMRANCSCILIEGPDRIIVDTMTPWDSDKIIHALKQKNYSPEDINYVISTHGHSDHTGNNNLFLKAKHIVGFSISFQDKYFLHSFDKGEEYLINESVKIVPTPGHTLSDVTVLVQTNGQEIIAVTGDLFEKLEDIENSNIWLEAGSEDSTQQRKNRYKIAKLADWIVPGHGPMFKVTDCIVNKLKEQQIEQ